MQNIRNIIHSVEPFNVLEDVELAAVLEKGHVKELEKNEILFHEGLKATNVYIFLSGCIQLKITAENGREMVVRTMDQPCLFAEVVLSGRNEYPVTALALKNTRVFGLQLNDFRGLLEISAFRDAFIQDIMKKQVYLTKQLMYYIGNDVEQRLYHFLAQRYPDQSHITLDITKKDMANAIGTVPETLSRLFKRLEKEGTLKRDGKVLTVLVD